MGLWEIVPDREYTLGNSLNSFNIKQRKVIMIWISVLSYLMTFLVMKLQGSLYFSGVELLEP